MRALFLVLVLCLALVRGVSAGELGYGTVGNFTLNVTAPGIPDGTYSMHLTVTATPSFNGSTDLSGTIPVTITGGVGTAYANNNMAAGFPRQGSWTAVCDSVVGHPTWTLTGAFSVSWNLDRTDIPSWTEAVAVTMSTGNETLTAKFPAFASSSCLEGGELALIVNGAQIYSSGYQVGSRALPTQWQAQPTTQFQSGVPFKWVWRSRGSTLTQSQELIVMSGTVGQGGNTVGREWIAPTLKSNFDCAGNNPTAGQKPDADGDGIPDDQDIDDDNDGISDNADKTPGTTPQPKPSGTPGGSKQPDRPGQLPGGGPAGPNDDTQDIYGENYQALMDAGNSTSVPGVSRNIDFGDHPAEVGKTGEIDRMKTDAESAVGKARSAVDWAKSNFGDNKKLQLPQGIGTLNAWAFDMPIVGHFTISLQPYDSIVQVLRNLQLFAMYILFWWSTVRTLRSAMS